MRQVHRNDQDKYEVGEKIRLARKKKKMSQGDLMDVMDTDRETISRYENGNREMTICTLFQFAEALEIDPRELMPGRSQTLSTAKYAWDIPDSRYERDTTCR